MQRGYINLPEGQIHYWASGSGSPVLLMLHQTPSSSDEYSKVIPLVAGRCRVVAARIWWTG